MAEEFLEQYVIDTTGEMHRCTICEYIAVDYRDLSFHFRTTHVNNLSHCPICAVFCKSIYDVFKHFVTVHTLIRPYRCKLCNKLASVIKAKVIEHVVNVHRVGSLTKNYN